MTEPRTPYRAVTPDEWADGLAVLAERLRSAVMEDERPRPDVARQLGQLAARVLEYADGILFLGDTPEADAWALKTARAADDLAACLRRAQKATQIAPAKEQPQ